MINWETVVVSGTAALVGAAVALVASYLSHRWEVNQQSRKERNLVFGFLQALHDEIETLWETYLNVVGTKLEAHPNNEPFLLFWPASFDYFTIYNSNSLLISRVSDSDLRKSIVTGYTRAKGLLESFRLNNELVNRYQQLNYLFQATGLEAYKPLITSHVQSMIAYSQSLKKNHHELKVIATDLLRSLRKMGVLSRATIE